MNSSVGQLGSPIFRPVGGLFVSLVFHGILAMIFIGWFTSNLPKTGVLPPAISLQLGLYQLEQQNEPEVNNAPKQQMATREEVEPEVVEKIEKLPQTPLVDNGTLTRVTEKKRPPKKKPVQEKKWLKKPQLLPKNLKLLQFQPQVALPIAAPIFPAVLLLLSVVTMDGKARFINV